MIEVQPRNAIDATPSAMTARVLKHIIAKKDSRESFLFGIRTDNIPNMNAKLYLAHSIVSLRSLYIIRDPPPDATLQPHLIFRPLATAHRLG